MAAPGGGPPAALDLVSVLRSYLERMLREVGAAPLAGTRTATHGCPAPHCGARTTWSNPAAARGTALSRLLLTVAPRRWAA